MTIAGTRVHGWGRWRLLLLAPFAMLAACGGGLGGEQGPDPVVEDFGIAYVKRPLAVDQNGQPVQRDARRVLESVYGSDLWFRELASPSAPEHNVTERETGGAGDVRDVDVSYDGSRLLFAMRMPEIEGADPEDQPTWNIWEYEIDSDRLRRIIASDTVAEEGQDLAPRYLPDGRILFTSTRQRRSRAVLLDEGKPQFGALDEDRNEPFLALHVMNPDGTDIHQISFNQSHDLDPAVLSDGHIVFSRWDHMGGRNEIGLYRTRPDGQETHILYGSHSHATGTDGGLVQFLRPREMPDGRIMVILRPFSGTFEGGDMVAIDVAGYADNDQPVADNPGQTGPAQVPVSAGDVRTIPGPSPGGRFISAWPLWDGTPRALVSWSQCRLQGPAPGEILPCTAEALADPGAVEGPPLYSVFIYNLQDHTLLPVLVPEEGVEYTDVVAAQPRELPRILFDRQPGVELDEDWYNEGVGVIHIRSVYDRDGGFDGLGAPAADIGEMADPAITPADQRPARFLRVVKAVSMPDDNVVDIPRTAFGASTGQLMREIVAYAPVEPDGSVMVKVPANVPLAVSIVDDQGRRRGGRHRNWIHLRPGEVLECNGCHDHATGIPHGRPEGPASIHPGAPTSGQPWPNTRPEMAPEMGETMAQTRYRLSCETGGCASIEPSLDLRFSDVWTDPDLLSPAPDLVYAYADLRTPIPTTPACVGTWSAICRGVIHYEQHIHPLWGLTRQVVDEATGNVVADHTCTRCHDPVDALGNPQVPAAQLDLGDGASDQEPDHFKSYRELLFPDVEQTLEGGVLVDRLEQATDADGNPLYEVDDNGDLILDEQGNPIPVLVTVPARGPSMSVNGARASYFLDLFSPGGVHEGWLEPAELRLIAEWLDLGAQYYNDPFQVPVN